MSGTEGRAGRIVEHTAATIWLTFRKISRLRLF